MDESMTKTVFNGKIIIPLPNVLVGNRYYSMFSISSPTYCDDCFNKLHVNSLYTLFILSEFFHLFWFFFFRKNHEISP